MNVTYLLGAGASYYAVPIVSDLGLAFDKIRALCKYSINSQSDKELINSYKEFESHMQSYKACSEVFGTIDTYAKSLSFTNEFDLTQLKASLSLFFTIWQETKKSNKFINDTLNRSFNDIDPRYFGLLTNYLKGYGTNIEIKENVNFITWNYDNQIERALGYILTKPLTSVFEKFKIYPSFSETLPGLPTILHLNGIAGLYEQTNSNDKLSKLIVKDTTIEDEFEQVNDILKKRYSFSQDVINNKSLFTFAWENDPVSKKSIEYMQKIIEKTNILIIIGYSFPTFNDEIDKKLFDAINPGILEMIYFQDPSANKELLSLRFGIHQSKIRIVTDTRQFVLPLDSHSYQQTGSGFFVL